MLSEKKSAQQGQILLIIIMLVATVVTVVTTISFKSNTDTQISKLEEESQKAMTAAEAGIEKAIGDQKQSGVSLYTDLNLGNLTGINLDTSSVNITTTTGTDFLSPLLQQDQQYTFYLSNYDTLNNTFTSPYVGTVRVRYGSEANNCSSLALEIVVITGNAPYTIRRYIADQGNLLSSSTDDIYLAGAPQTVNGVIFYCQTNNTTLSFLAGDNAKLLIVRTIGDKTRLNISGNTPLRSQGKFIVSEARSDAGVVKKIQLFQSLPQIPAEFFVTTF